MDLQHAHVLLEKISALQKSISLDKGDISAIERDLMLSYIRQLYEVYRMPAVAVPTAPVVAAPAAPKAAPAPPPAPAPEPPQPQPAPVVVEAPAPPPPAPAPVVEVAPPPAPTPAPVPAPAPPPAPVVEPTPVAPVSRGASAAVEALFHHTAAREVSEKLAQQPITDLTKAMTINDKILYANDLFNRSNDALNQALLQINALPNMDAAKNLLVDLATQYQWTEGERPETAEAFIKLVRRRF
jgi:hypothetical protein